MPIPCPAKGLAIPHALLRGNLALLACTAWVARMIGLEIGSGEAGQPSPRQGKARDEARPCTSVVIITTEERTGNGSGVGLACVCVPSIRFYLSRWLQNGHGPGDFVAVPKPDWRAYLDVKAEQRCTGKERASQLVESATITDSRSSNCTRHACTERVSLHVLPRRCTLLRRVTTVVFARPNAPCPRDRNMEKKGRRPPACFLRSVARLARSACSTVS